VDPMNIGGWWMTVGVVSTKPVLFNSRGHYHRLPVEGGRPVRRRSGRNVVACGPRKATVTALRLLPFALDNWC
jgi:hypothetical protein